MFSSSFNHSIILFPFYKILKLRGQAEEQEASLKAQEEEVNTKKRELEVLIEEEQKLNSDIKKSQRDIEMLVKSLSDVEKLLEEVFTRCLCVKIVLRLIICRQLESVASTKSSSLILSRRRRGLTRFWALPTTASPRMCPSCTWSRSDTPSRSQTSRSWTSRASRRGPRLRARCPRCRTGATPPLMIPSATSQCRRQRPTTCSTMMMRSLRSTINHQRYGFFHPLMYLIFYFVLFYFYFCCRLLLTLSVTLVPPDLLLEAPVPSLAISLLPTQSIMTPLLHLVRTDL